MNRTCPNDYDDYACYDDYYDYGNYACYDDDDYACYDDYYDGDDYYDDDYDSYDYYDYYNDENIVMTRSPLLQSHLPHRWWRQQHSMKASENDFQANCQ